MKTVNQPSANPTRKLSAATIAAAVMPCIGLVLRNAAPDWYDPEVLMGLTPVVVFLLGYVVKDAPNT